MNDVRIRKQGRKKLSKISTKQIEKWFDNVASSNLSTDGLAYIVGKITSIVGVTTIPIATPRLYRCRPLKENDIKPQLLSDMLHPPIKSTAMGRCNLSRKPVLYLSDNLGCLREECHLFVGQRFCILQFDHLSNVTEDLQCILLGVEAHLALPSEPLMHKINIFRSEFYGKEYKKHKQVSSFLHKEFIKEDDGSGTVYSFTASFCDSLFCKVQTLDAIFYPSIATKGAGRNYAVKPEAINKAYKPTKIVMYELGATGDMVLLEGGSVLDDKIIWGAGEPLDSPIPVGIHPVDIYDPELYVSPWK